MIISPGHYSHVHTPCLYFVFYFLNHYFMNTCSPQAQILVFVLVFLLKSLAFSLLFSPRVFGI